MSERPECVHLFVFVRAHSAYECERVWLIIERHIRTAPTSIGNNLFISFVSKQKKHSQLHGALSRIKKNKTTPTISPHHRQYCVLFYRHTPNQLRNSQI